MKGIFLSLEIILIVFGAIFFISVLKISNLEKKIKSLVENISQDRRVQLVIIAWAFTALIEGSAGFGAPAILASAILIALNFPIVQAVIFSLVGSAIHTSFGAVGTPIVFGFGASLAQSDVLIFLQNQNLSFTEFLGGIAVNIAFFNLFIGVAICFIMMFLLIFIFNKEGKNKIKHFLEIIPFITIASLLVTIPAYLISVFFGPELPSLIGGLIGLFLILIIAQKS
ncbi:MAG: L-lactate permease [Candidatus Pacebacteria bacterium]|nr:L-lactate permease [Candidatus Paceibacterota bacterium]